MSIRVYLHVYGGVCICVHAQGPEEVPGVLLNHSLPFPLRQSLSLNLELIFSQLGGKPATLSHLLVFSYIDGEVTGIKETSSSLHGYTQPACFTAEPSFQILVLNFM